MTHEKTEAVARMQDDEHQRQARHVSPAIPQGNRQGSSEDGNGVLYRVSYKAK